MRPVYFSLCVPLLLCLALTACANYPSANLHSAILPAEQVEERFTLDSAWWKLYADPHLDSLMDMALARNVNLARSTVSINRALYRGKLLGVDLVPAFSAESSASVQRYTESGIIGRSQQSQVSINYELDLWQRLRNAASAQEWEYRATLEDRLATRLALINAVTDSYFEIRYLDQSIMVTKASIARYEKLQAITQLRYDLGKVAHVEPLQAAQSLLSAQNNMLTLRNQKTVAEQTLRDLLNLHPDDEQLYAVMFASAPDLLATHTVPVNLQVPLAALAARPDIQAAESRLQSAFKTLQSTNAEWYPTVTVGSTLGASSERGMLLFDVPLLSGLLKISFPFLQWNRVRWNIKVSEADFETAKLNFIESVTTALNEVSMAYASSQHARDTLRNTLDKYDKDVQITTYYKNRYDLGAAELKDYLEALNTEDTSLLAALKAKYSLINGENAVYKAMGGRYQEKDALKP